MDEIEKPKDFFEAIPDYRKIVLIMFLFKNVFDFLTKCAYPKIDNICISSEIKNISKDQNGKYLKYTKNEEESNIERISKN